LALQKVHKEIVKLIHDLSSLVQIRSLYLINKLNLGFLKSLTYLLIFFIDILQQKKSKASGFNLKLLL